MFVTCKHFNRVNFWTVRGFWRGYSATWLHSACSQGKWLTNNRGLYVRPQNSRSRVNERYFRAKTETVPCKKYVLCKFSTGPFDLSTVSPWTDKNISFIPFFIPFRLRLHGTGRMDPSKICTVHTAYTEPSLLLHENIFHLHETGLFWDRT